MKHVFLALCLIAAMHTAHAQKGTFDIETTKFDKFLTTTSHSNIVRRFDKLSRLTMEWRSHPDDTIDVFLYDYDAAGNLTQKTYLVFGRDKNRPHAWISVGEIEESVYEQAIHKMLDRLDGK